MLLVVFRSGRAGNQLFQLAALEAVRLANDRVLFVGFGDLVRLVPGLRQAGWFAELPAWVKRNLTRIDEGLKLLARLRLIGGVFEVGGGAGLIRTRGLLPFGVFWGGWCQNEDILDTSLILGSCEIELQKVDLPLFNLPKETLGESTCFIHVRRGDYLRFPSADSPAALPSRWFISQMGRMRRKIGRVHFFVFSDDEDYAMKIFGSLPNTTVVSCDERQAFYAMASCANGILSPSTFSWWAAKVAHSRSGGLFFAPSYWAGWGVSEWVPYRFINSSFLNFSQVPSTDLPE